MTTEEKGAANCARCGRALANEESKKRGMGPVCFSKCGAHAEAGELIDGQPVLEGVGTLEEVGLVCRQLADGRLACNVPQVVVYHSPTGFACGYGGSGPADLALNVMHQLLPHRAGSRDSFTSLRNGTKVSDDAYRLHQDFKWQFISTMPETGGRVPIEDISAWIARRILKEAA